MNVVLGSASSDPMVGVFAVLSVGVILYLVRDTARDLIFQRRQRRARQRQRTEPPRRV